MTLVLIEGDEKQRFEPEEFPLAVGVTRNGTLVVGHEAESAPAAWILSHHGKYSLQPESSRIPVGRNGTALTEPAWIEDGDALSLGHFTIHVSASVDNFVLTRGSGPDDSREPAEPSPDSNDIQSQLFGRKLASAHARSSSRFSFTVARNFVLSLFILLALGVAFVLIASPVNVRISPTPENFSIPGFPPPVPISGRYLVLPGSYEIEARKPGYKVLRHRFSVAFGDSPSLDLALQKLPGIFSITTPPIEAARIFIDGKAKGLSPIEDLEVDAGEREIRVTSERHLPEVRRLDVRGLGERQSLEIPLKPAWGTISVDTLPPGSLVWMDGKEVGRTPLTFEPLQGSHELAFTMDGWKLATRNIEIRAGEIVALPAIQLEKIDGTLDLNSEPPGATITIDGAFRGRTPAMFPLISDRAYQLRLSKSGFVDTTRTIRVEGGKTMPLLVPLQPEFGTVFLTTSPPGSKLFLNGRPSGSATQRLRLTTVPQSIEIRKKGYLPFRTTVTPRSGIARKITVTLKTAGEALRLKDKKGAKTRAGQRLRLVSIQEPVRFRVGAPRRERGRRSNEVEYTVELNRSFWISEKEVTNAEFKKFNPRHSSGNYRGSSLDKADQPVVNVSWENAARYANWLSKQEGLQPAYTAANGTVVPVVPITNGYRLPTEAEWTFVSRYDGGAGRLKKPRRFPWGSAMPPPNNSGNYANDGGQRLPVVIPGYIDAFPVAAPVGKFKPNKLSLYDLGGNVAEWCHDYYDVPTTNATLVRRDPSGPKHGRFHTIKGASWRSGSISELRLSYRDYAQKARNDVGFRIARYVEDSRK